MGSENVKKIEGEINSENKNNIVNNTKNTDNSFKNIEKNENKLKKANPNHQKIENEDILKYLQNFENKAEKYTSKLSKDINTLKNENIELKKEIKNLKLILESIINNGNNKSKDSSLNTAVEKNSEIVKDYNQLSSSVENQINPKNINSYKNQKKNNNNNNMGLQEFKSLIQTKKSKEKNNYHFLKLNPEFDNEILELLIKSMNFNKRIELNKKQVFQLIDIEKKSGDIYNRILKQLATYKRKEENYMMKKASFLKNVGYLVRLSHELADYIIVYLMKFFEEIIGIHSLEEETIRLNFACWIKNTFEHQQFFLDIINSQNTLSQIKELSKTEKYNFFIELFPNLIQLYFQCFITNLKVDIIYAKEDEEFDFDRMSDDLFADSEKEIKVLFTFLPGLFGNNQFLNDSKIHTITYKVDEPNKLKFQKPIFLNIELNINISCVKKIKKVEFFYKKKNRHNNGYVEVEFQAISEPDISWDFPKYEFILLDSDNYIIKDNITLLEEANYGRCICNLILNNKLIASSTPIILDLSQKL